MKNTPSHGFWKGKRVLVTGNTGFKGSWLCLWLKKLGADVVGFSLPEDTPHSLFCASDLKSEMQTTYGDVRNLSSVQNALKHCKPEIIFHLAAQPLVSESYRDPVATLSTNVLGTAHVLEAIRKTDSVRSAVIVTTDKCYENLELTHGYTESDRLGGADPYSCSKACAELITASYLQSYFTDDKHSASIATARAGNVIGGGDWSKDRIIPDLVKAVNHAEPFMLRNPLSVRPWQHVLEPLSGYMSLAKALYEKGDPYSGAWNFGPVANEARTVSWLTDMFLTAWGEQIVIATSDSPKKIKETHFLQIDSSKANKLLDWFPRWNAELAVRKTVEWYKSWAESSCDLKQLSFNQINEYEDLAVQVSRLEQSVMRSSTSSVNTVNQKVYNSTAAVLPPVTATTVRHIPFLRPTK